MPYIKEENRAILDGDIQNIVQSLKRNVGPNENSPHKEKLTNEEFMNICGDINYLFSRIIAGVMGDVSYSKVAIITGVLENIKQEFYRRIATPYENHKIIENGDITEYKKFKIL